MTRGSGRTDQIDRQIDIQVYVPDRTTGWELSMENCTSGQTKPAARESCAMPSLQVVF